MARFFQRLRRALPSGSEDPETRYFKIAVYALVGLFVLMAVVGITVFFVTIEGAEETLVPDLREMALVDALLALQERGLYPEIRTQFSADPTLKDHVIAQDPSPGTVVKAGKLVDLVVSKGSIVDTVEDYRGWDLRDVEIRLRELSASYQAILRIGTVSYRFDEAEPGTVLQQDPPAGSELLSLTDLDLVVSRGPDVETFELDAYVGLDFQRAVELFDRDDIPFAFTVREPEADEEAGVIVAQSPEAGTEVTRNQIVRLEMTAPDEVPEDRVFGLFSVTLPDYAVALEVRLVALSSGGAQRTIFTIMHPGGPLSVPFVELPRTELVLYQGDRDVRTLLVEAPPEEEDEQ